MRSRVPVRVHHEFQQVSTSVCRERNHAVVFVRCFSLAWAAALCSVSRPRKVSRVGVSVTITRSTLIYVLQTNTLLIQAIKSEQVYLPCAGSLFFPWLPLFPLKFGKSGKGRSRERTRKRSILRLEGSFCNRVGRGRWALARL